MNDLANDIIGYVILIGIIASYIPQYVKIIRAKSSSGISDIFLFIGFIGSIASVNNALIFYYPEWEECAGFEDCDTRILGFNQLLAQCLCFFIFYLIFILYFSNSDKSSYPKISKRAKAWILFLFSDAILISLSAITVKLTIRDFTDMKTLDGYADSLSVIVITTACIQYVPQIFKTYSEKFPGSLSLITLAIQCPGSFAWTIFLALQDGGNISTWLPYLITGCLQLLLLIMGTYFYHKNKDSRARYEHLIATFN